MFDAQDKAELFNNYFNSVFKSIECVPLHEDYFLGDFDVGADVLNNVELSPAIVLKFLEQLKICKSCGPDNVTSRLLKEYANSISSPLYTLFNKQLSSGCFPKMWKAANLVPVFKSGSKEMVENYRGISLLCIISKVLEKCVFHVFFNSSSRNLTIYKTTLSRDVHVLQVFSGLLSPLPKHLMRRNSLMQYFWITVKLI